MKDFYKNMIQESENGGEKYLQLINQASADQVRKVKSAADWGIWTAK